MSSEESPHRPGDNSIGIIGGGIIGLSAAWRLAQRGFPVAVYDRSRFGGEASWAGAGMLAPGGEVEDESELAQAAIASRRLYPAYISELERASGHSIDYQECGALELAYSPEELEALTTRAARQQTTLGIPSKAVSPESVHAFWPRIQTAGLAGARFYPEDAIVNPREIVAALIETTWNVGVQLHENSPVAEARIEANAVTLTHSAGTSQHAAVILAAGAWSSEIKVCGVPQPPLAEPVKGHLLGYQQPDQTCTTIIRHSNTYLLQRSNGMLLAGASVERVGFERGVRPEITARLAADAGAILPHLSETTPTESWTGFRPGSDTLHVGRWHSPRFHLAYGHYRNGILLAPWTADQLVRSITASLGTP